MTYQQTVLNDKPAGFWMITAASGTSETDLSGNSKTATITEATDLIDRGYRPLVTGTSTDRAYRFYSGNHKLTYPTLEIWDKGRNHIPFSVEFTVQPITSRRRVDLFAPQEASSASVPNNGIYLENGRLYFEVSNGSAANVPTLISVASTWLSTGTTYHVVAVYDVSKIYIYVDGVLAATEAVDPGIVWSHTTANFITTAYSLSSDATSSSFLFDAVSVYRASLSPTVINNHYVMSTPNISDLEIVNSLGGKIIKLNDEDRTKAFEYSAKERGWSSNLNVITDLVQNDDGSLGLKKIAPLKLYNTNINYSNLLTWNQATAEEGTTGWLQGANCTIARSATQASQGSYSMAATAGSTSDVSVWFAHTSTFAPIVGGRTHRITADVRKNIGTATASIVIVWLNAAGIDVGGGGVIASGSVNAAGWTTLTATSVAPVTATRFAAYIYFEGGTINAGEILYIDKTGVWEGTSTNWTPPLIGETFIPNQELSTRSKNLLPYNAATAEIDAVTAMGGTGSNHTLTRSIAEMYSGNASFRTESTGAGGVISITAYQSGGIKVEPGRTYTTTVKYKPVTTARNIQQYVNWYDSTLTLIGNGGVSSVATTLNTWNTYKRTVIAPPRAVYCDMYCQTASSAVAGEVFYWDELGLMEGDTTQWYSPLFNVDEINLGVGKYASVLSAGQHLGKDQGGFGFFMDVTATENDHVGEQVAASLSSSDSTFIIEVVKKTDKNLYIRYRYRNQSGVITTTETSWGAISSLLATTPYIYVEWGGGLLSLYVNSTSSPAQIAFDVQIPAPRFDEQAYFNLGAGYEGNRPWNNNFKWLKLYNKIQPTSDFVYNQTSVNGFTAKLGSSLNVSQSGRILLEAPTGYDGVSTIDQTRVTWEPLSQNATVSTSTSGVNNLLTYNQATGGELGNTTGFTSRGGAPTLARNTALFNSGSSSISATATATNNCGVGTQASGSTVGAVPASPGKVYTAHVMVRTSRTSMTGTFYIIFIDSGGTQISFPSTAINATNTGWTQVTVSGTAPANTAFVGLTVDTSLIAIGEINYIDELGIWEGTSTTWTEPPQTAVYGSEIVANQFPTVLPNNYYASATLSTDDSYYAPTKLSDLKLEAHADNTQFAENGWDQLVGSTRDLVYPANLPEVSQDLYNGAVISSTRNAFYIFPVNDTSTTSIPDGGTASSTAGPEPLIRTVEFWLYPQVQGYYNYYDGPTEYSMRYYDSGGFTTTGYTTLYVDGAAVSNGATSTTWYNRWHHIILTNASAQINLKTDTPAGVNLLTVNQASIETDTSGFSQGGWSGYTRSRDTAVAWQGSASHKAIRDTVTGILVLQVDAPRTTVEPNTVYTASVYQKYVGVVASPTFNIIVGWFNSGGGIISQTSLVSTTLPSGGPWVQLSVSGTSPSDAVSARIDVYTSNLDAGDAGWWDGFMLTEGTSTKWALPGEIPGKNLLTPNQSTGGDHLGSALGFTDHAAGGITYDTTRSVTGAGSIKHTAVSVRHSTSTLVQLTPVVPEKTYTAQAKVYPGASPTGGFGWALYIEWRDINSVVLSQSLSSVTLTQDRWNTMTVTGVAPPGTAQALVLIYRNEAAGVTPEDAWMDDVGLWEGSSTTWSKSDQRMNFGIPPIGGTQAVGRYQNISYYPQTFDAGMVTTNYKAYLGDTIGGSTTDYANMLTLNQATAETDTTGMSVTFNPGGLTYTYTSATDQFYSGSRSFKVTYTSGTGIAQTNFGQPTGTAGHRVTPGGTYTAVARVRCTAARNAQLSIDWWTAAGSYISSSASGASVVANTWESRTTTATAPPTAAYANITMASLNPASGDSYWFDELGFWSGAATTWVSPLATSATRAISDTSPTFYNDIWTTETIKIR